LCSVVAYENELSTLRRTTKNRTTKGCAICFSFVIRLGFGRITCFPAKSCGLLAVSTAYKVLKYNDINYIWCFVHVVNSSTFLEEGLGDVVQMLSKF